MTELKQFIDAHFIGEVVSEICLEDDFYVFSIQIKDSQSNIRILYPKDQMIPLSKGDLIDGKGKLFYVEEEGNAFYCPADYIVRICCCESKSVPNNHEIEKEKEEVVEQFVEQNENFIPSVDSEKKESETGQIPSVPTILKLSPPPSLVSTKEEVKEIPHENSEPASVPAPHTESTKNVEPSAPPIVEKSDSQPKEPSSAENEVPVIGRFSAGDFDC